MTQVAIKLSFENLIKIMNTESIDPETLFDKAEKYAAPSSFWRRMGYEYYFVPDRTTFTGVRLTWAFIRSDAFERCFDYDKTRIDTEFVEITQHSPI